MNFHSASFGIFMIVVFAAFWAVVNRRGARMWLLLGASYFFYGSWEFWYLSLIVFSTFLDYWCGGKIHGSSDPAVRKRFLLVSLLGNLGVLSFFKYFDWGLETVAVVLEKLGIESSLGPLGILVPVGISFYTFQTLSYTIDIYRGVLKPARNMKEFALFVAFFPQLVAGPIVRAVEFLPQLEERPRLARLDLHNGLYRIGLGLAKKVVIADQLGGFLVDPVYGDPTSYTFVAHLLAIYGFAFQIYFDFSGYSDIAIGAARLFGFRLPENFDLPYRSASVREFWRRWHISLSSWVRDYIYFPLGGSRGSELRVVRNLILTMLIIGLWHGASWLWVCYGLLNGITMSLERWFERMRGGGAFATTRFKTFLSWAMTFHFIAFSTIFIRATSMENAWDMVAGLGEIAEIPRPFLWALVGGVLTHFLPRRFTDGIGLGLQRLPTVVCGLVLGIVVGLVAMLVVGETPYIYFQF